MSVNMSICVVFSKVNAAIMVYAPSDSPGYAPAVHSACGVQLDTEEIIWTGVFPDNHHCLSLVYGDGDGPNQQHQSTEGTNTATTAAAVV